LLLFFFLFLSFLATYLLRFLQAEVVNL
jgi:hypothetical protein